MRHLLTWLDSYYRSRDGDQDPRSSFIYPCYMDLLNIHDCKHRSIDGFIHTMLSIDMDLQIYFHTGSLRHLYFEYENALLQR